MMKYLLLLCFLVAVLYVAGEGKCQEGFKKCSSDLECANECICCAQNSHVVCIRPNTKTTCDNTQPAAQGTAWLQSANAVIHGKQKRETGEDDDDEGFWESAKSTASGWFEKAKNWFSEKLG